MAKAGLVRPALMAWHPEEGIRFREGFLGNALRLRATNAFRNQQHLGLSPCFVPALCSRVAARREVRGDYLDSAFLPTIPFVGVPVFRWAVRAFVSSHIERVVEQLDRCYQLRLATDPSGADDWKKLSDQAEAMNAGLPPFLSAKWALILAALVFVFLTGKLVPAADFALIAKMIAAIVTVSPDKLTELAAEPGAQDALLRMVGVALMMSVAGAPILIYHFRFKRMLLTARNRGLPPALGRQRFLPSGRSGRCQSTVFTYWSGTCSRSWESLPRKRSPRICWRLARFSCIP
jgi:hypothetical protein